MANIIAEARQVIACSDNHVNDLVNHARVNGIDSIDEFIQDIELRDNLVSDFISRNRKHLFEFDEVLGYFPLF